MGLQKANLWTDLMKDAIFELSSQKTLSTEVLDEVREALNSETDLLNLFEVCLSSE